MKRFIFSVVIACALCAATAVAQVAPGGSGQGTQQSSPSMSGPRGQQQPGTMGQPTDQTGTTDQTGNTSNQMGKSEKKLKGCVQSQGGQYVLETKKGKDIALTGQDVSAHVGHEVAVHGAWEKGGSMSQSSTGAASSNEKTFNVSSVDMISDTCGGKSKGKSSGMGTGANGTNPAGTGAGSTGAGGTGTQPPQ
jgi:Protein of unknown function (DUF5818)